MRRDGHGSCDRRDSKFEVLGSKFQTYGISDRIPSSVSLSYLWGLALTDHSDTRGVMMDCVFVRHGVAVEREEWEGKDVDRPLTEEGVRRVRQVAAGLRRLAVRPTVIYASPARRAADTAQLLHDLLTKPSRMEFRDELLPEAVPTDLLRLLQSRSSESCVICVGHEPQLGMAASVLLSGRASESFPLKKAGACLIELSIPVKPGQGLLRWWLTPGQLRVMGRLKTKS